MVRLYEQDTDPDRECWLYIAVSSDGYVKVGSTVDYKQRKKQLGGHYRGDGHFSFIPCFLISTARAARQIEWEFHQLMRKSPSMGKAKIKGERYATTMVNNMYSVLWSLAMADPGVKMALVDGRLKVTGLIPAQGQSPRMTFKAR